MNSLRVALSSVFTPPPGTDPFLVDVLFRLLVTCLAGQALGWVYMWSHGVLSYKPSFVRAVILLALVVCVVMNTVSGSLAQAFGLGAALATVRFRTALKEPRDALFLFGAVAIGMTAGSGLTGTTTVATIVLGLAALYLHGTSYGSRSEDEGSLCLVYRTSADGEALDAALAAHCRRWLLVKATPIPNAEAEERVYQVTLSNPQHADVLVSALTSDPSVTDARVLVRAHAGEA